MIQMSNDNQVKHLAFIMDGNRRFAEKYKFKPWQGHEKGADKLESVIDWCRELNIKELTLYTFSIENFNRPKREVDVLMQLFKKKFDDLDNNKNIMDNKIRINIMGRVERFPEEIQVQMKNIMEKTKSHENFVINFAMGYGGRAEIVDSVKKICLDVVAGRLSVDDINEDTISKSNYIYSEPELVIRTGGEIRTSNFLMWQSHYSEWIFLDKLWPEIEKSDIVGCLEEYSSRKRRFGK